MDITDILKQITETGTADIFKTAELDTATIEKKKKAKEKLEEEMSKENNSYVKCIGEFLIGYLEEHAEAANKIINTEKSITKSIEVLRKAAEKRIDIEEIKRERQTAERCIVLTDEEGFNLIRRYFGIIDGEDDIASGAEDACNEDDTLQDDTQGCDVVEPDSDEKDDNKNLR